MIISVFLYFLNLTRMYEDYLEDLLMASLQHFNLIRQFRNSRNDPEEHENTRQKIFNHLVVFILWCFTAIPAIPSVLVWAKNFRFGINLYIFRCISKNTVLNCCNYIFYKFISVMI